MASFPSLSGSANSGRSSSQSSFDTQQRLTPQIRRKPSVGNVLSSLVNTVRTTMTSSPGPQQSTNNSSSNLINSQNNHVYQNRSRAPSSNLTVQRSSASLASAEDQQLSRPQSTSSNLEHQHNRFNPLSYNLSLANSPTVANLSQFVTAGDETQQPQQGSTSTPLGSSTPLSYPQSDVREHEQGPYRRSDRNVSGTEANPILLDYDSDINMEDASNNHNEISPSLLTTGTSIRVSSARPGTASTAVPTEANGPGSGRGAMNINSDSSSDADNYTDYQQSQQQHEEGQELVVPPPALVATLEDSQRTPQLQSAEPLLKPDHDGMFSIRFTPFIDHSSSTPFMYFAPLIRKISPGMKLPIGRYTEKSKIAASAPQGSSAAVVFKSKVVSRQHAELTVDENGNWFLKDVRSSSGTFLNGRRLCPANVESPNNPLTDSDILQLGMDYRGGSEDIYRCVKVKIELNSSWNRRTAKFNKDAHDRLKKLTLSTDDEEVSPCAICLGSIKPCQAVFVSSCSHSWHYKCIRPIVVRTYPQFLCPNCKAVCDMEADFDETDESDSDREIEDGELSVSNDELLN